MSKFHGNSKQLAPIRKLANTSKLAEAFTVKQINIVLDLLENALLVDGVIVYDRKKADKVIGERIALAYAMGALDKTENKFARSIIV